jgi:hypothetical protein
MLGVVYADCHAEWHYKSFMISVIMLNVITLKAFMPKVVMLGVTISLL